MDDLISRKWLMECVNEGWIKFDTEKDKNIYVHLVRDIAPSAQSDNQVHLCDSCKYTYPECPSGSKDVIYGNGKGNDNICACNKYEPSAQPEKRTEERAETHACDLIDRQAAIDALEREKSLVERPITETRWFDFGLRKAQDVLSEVPSAQPEIIRCRDCKYGEQDEIGRWYCRGLGCQMGDDDGNGFCSDAEKREE